jgi:hypothetical protein
MKLHQIGSAVFGLFVIFSASYVAFEILRELGAPDGISAIGAVCVFVGTLKLVDRPK